MKSKVAFERLTSVDAMRGEDDEETVALHQMLKEAGAYLQGFRWCHSITQEWLGFGIGGVVGVFLFELDGEPEVDDLLWVVAGDVPVAYLVVDEAHTPREALTVYCSLMQDWVSAVEAGASLEDVYPVEVAPTKANAARLKRRIDFLLEEVIPQIQE